MSDPIEYRHSPYGQLIGTRILHSDPEQRTIEIEYLADERFTNRIGSVAGAMLAGLLDSVTGLVANVDLQDGLVAVHRSLAVEYHVRAKPGRFIGRGRVVDQDDRDIRSRGELFDPTGERVATAEAALRIIRFPAPGE